MRRCVAVDPGLTTGLAFWQDEWWAPQLEELPLFDAIAKVHHALHTSALTYVVCEDYIVTVQTAKKSRQTSAPDGLGALRYLTQLYDVPLATWKPAEAKTFASDDLLKRIGWYVKGQPHARDASRHLILFLVRSGWIPPERVLRARNGLSEPDTGSVGADSEADLQQ